MKKSPEVAQELAAVRARLQELEAFLHRHNSFWAADCLHRFNAANVDTLDAAFGLTSEREKSSSNKVRNRDVQVIRLRMAGKTWTEICDALDINDPRDSQRMVAALTGKQPDKAAAQREFAAFRRRARVALKAWADALSSEIDSAWTQAP